MRTLSIGAVLLVLLAGALACGGGDGPAAEPAATPAAAAEPGHGQQATPHSDRPSGHLEPRVTAGAQPLPPAEPVETPAPYNTDPYAGYPTFAPEGPPASAPAETTSWRIYSEAIYYDAGGGGDLSTVITTTLELSADGGWSFSDSAGTWSVEGITAEDWARWGIEPYGPASKIVLYGWNGGTADGPMEESGGVVDFIWVIYPEGPPVIGAPGTVWMKFGRS